MLFRSPGRNTDWIETMPLAQRWSQRRDYGTEVEHLQASREQIDDLRIDEVKHNVAVFIFIFLVNSDGVKHIVAIYLFKQLAITHML